MTLPIPEETHEKPSPKSLLTQHPFQDFSLGKFRKMLKSENTTDLVKTREEVLNYRHKVENEELSKLLQTQNATPRSYEVCRGKL